MKPESFEKVISQVEAVFNAKYTPAQKEVYYICLNGTPDEVWQKALKSLLRRFRPYGDKKLPFPVDFEEAIKEISQPTPEREVPIEERSRVSEENFKKLSNQRSAL